MRHSLTSLLAICSLALIAPQHRAAAELITIANANSELRVDTAAGTINWSVDGMTYVDRHWFWYRAGAMSDESSLNSLMLLSQGLQDNYAWLRYMGNKYLLSLGFQLDGGEPGSGDSVLTEVITLSNMRSTPLVFHFFEYTDTNLLGETTGQFVQFPSPGTVDQTMGDVFQSAEAVPSPSHYEAADAGSILARFSDGQPTTLADYPPLGAPPLQLDDASWAFQWDFTVGGLANAAITERIVIDPVPEPAAIVLLASGLLFVLIRRRHANIRS